MLMSRRTATLLRHSVMPVDERVDMAGSGHLTISVRLRASCCHRGEGVTPSLDCATLCRLLLANLSN